MLACGGHRPRTPKKEPRAEALARGAFAVCCLSWASGHAAGESRGGSCRAAEPCIRQVVTVPAVAMAHFAAYQDRLGARNRSERRSDLGRHVAFRPLRPLQRRHQECARSRGSGGWPRPNAQLTRSRFGKAGRSMMFERSAGRKLKPTRAENLDWGCEAGGGVSLFRGM